MNTLPVGGDESLDFDRVLLKLARIILILMAAGFLDEDRRGVHNGEDLRSILKKSIRTDIGLTFWEELFMMSPSGRRIVIAPKLRALQH
jgi:hypothetical protein